MTSICNCDALKSSSVKNTIAVSRNGTTWWMVFVAESRMLPWAAQNKMLMSFPGFVRYRMARTGPKDLKSWPRTNSTDVHGVENQVLGRRGASGVK